jgi:hypothetical protein
MQQTHFVKRLWHVPHTSRLQPAQTAETALICRIPPPSTGVPEVMAPDAAATVSSDMSPLAQGPMPAAAAMKEKLCVQDITLSSARCRGLNRHDLLTAARGSLVTI